MKQKSIMKKSAFMTRRKIIIYIVLTILILGIVAGFTDPFTSDNTKYSAGKDEIIVMEAEPPADGSPEDYDLISNLKFAAYKLHHASFFRGETNGKVIADLGITTYTQNIHNTRYATDEGVVFAETISSSSMKSVAEQKYADNGIIIFRPSTSINGANATFSNSAYAMTYEDYSKNYGSIPNQLSKYIINETTIKSVKDENAQTKAAANAANGEPQARAEAGFDFYVPDSLVAGEDGTYRFSLTLDATASTLYYRNEVRTLGGADQNPKFYSVSITVTIDKNWNPISVYSVENYDIAIPVLGAMNCTGRLTEVFTQLDDPDGVVPERDFFQPYVDEAKRNPDFNGGGNIPPQEDNSAAAYLAAAFGDYISGAKNLDLTIDMAVGDFTAYDLTLSLNIDTMAVRAMLGNLYVGYSGDKVNIKLNDINGYVSAAEFSELLKNEQIKNLFGGLGEFDVTQLFGGDILGTVFENCEMTTDNGIRRIHLPFAIDTSSFGADGLTSVEVDASIYIKEDGKILQSITGDISVLGKTINVVAKPLKTAPVFPATDNATDLSGILDFLPDLIATATRPTLDISGQIVAMGQTVNVDAYIDRTNGFKVEAVLSVMGADLFVKYVDGTVYVGLGNIDARGTAEELPTLVNALLDTVDLGKYADLIRMLMPKSLNDVVSMIKSLDVSENEITLELNFLTSPVTVYAKRGDGMIAGFGMGIDFDMLGIKFDAAADFDISAPEAREIELPSGDDYITFAQLAQLITDITPYLESSANYDIAFRGNVAQGANVYAVDGAFTIDKLTDNDKQVYGVTAAGAAVVLGQTVNIVHVDGVTYIEFAGLRAKLASSDAGKFKSPVLRIINALADAATFDPANIVSGAVEAVKSVTVNDDGALVIIISVNGDDLTVVFAPKLGTVSVAGVVDGIAVDLEITVGITNAVRDISAPQNASEYMNAAELDVTLEKLADIVEVKAISAPLAVTADGTTYTALFELSFADGLKARLTENTLGLDVTLYGGKIYFALEDIRIVATPDDISPLIAALDGIVPADILQMLESTLNGGINVQAALRSALAAIGSSKLKNGIITVTPVVGATTVEIAVATDLSKITVDASGISVKLEPQASPVTIPAPIGEYAQAKDVIAAFAPMAPLASGDAIEIGVNAEIYGVPVIGFAYVSFAGASLADMQAEINVRVGDLPVIVTVRNATVFIKIGANIRLSEELNEKSIMALVDKLDYAIAGLKQTVQKIIDSIKSMTVRKLLDALALYPVENGFAVSVDLTSSGLDIAARISALNTDGVLSSVRLDCNMLGISVATDFDAVVTDGALAALVCKTADVAGVPLSIALAPIAVDARNVTVITDCAQLSAAANYIEPVLNLVNAAMTARSVTFDINASMVTADNNYAQIKGTARVCFAPLALDLSLRLFADTPSEEYLNIVFTNNTLYLQSGNIKLSFDTATDLGRLYAVVESYVQKGWLPEYLGKEIGKLFGIEQGASIFSDITLLVERFEEIASSDGTPQTVVGLLFAPLKGLNNDSAVKAVIDMLRIFGRGEDVVVSVDALGATLNVTPRIGKTTAADGSDISVIDSVSVDTNLFGVYFNASVYNYDLRDGAIDIAPPVNAMEYVSIVEFVDTVNNFVNTLTARDLNDNITFALNTFAFDYDIFKIETTVNENGEVVNVKDEAGRDKPLIGADGNKVVDQTIKVGNKPDGSPVLKGKFERREVKDVYGNTVTDEFGEPVSEYKFSLEAHVKIEISTPDSSSAVEYTNMSPLLVDLYVINNDSYPDGMAFLDYMENNGNGERISIDYTSVMEIVAAAMDIMGVNADTVELLLGEYRQAIDKTVFESLDLGGVVDLRAMLNGVADAVNDGKAALKDVKSAWNLVMTAGSTENLRNRLDDIKPLIENAIIKIQSAIAAFGGDGATATVDDGTEINGKLYKDIVNGVTIEKNGDTIWATVENEIATGTSGTSYVTVTQSNNTIDSIQVRGLDVNTAKLKEFTANFTAGEDITVALPSDYNTSKSNADYSDFANIKHLLFDVMNTANLMEFEAGDVNNATNDNKINITLKLGIIDAFNINVKYNVKVKIIDQGENANPRYKTAVVVELIFSGCKALGAQAIYDCTTRLYFYDDIIYIQGVQWYEEPYKNWLGQTKYEWKRRDVTVKYTLDELSAIMANGNSGTEKFMYEFLFLLMPLSRNFMVFSVDLQKEIVKAALEMVTDDKNRTFAKVFKGYSYTDGKHDMTIGLKELVGVSAFNDLNLSITGANDGDDNILDNYVSNLHIDTSFIGMVTLSLDAKLNNANVYTDADGVNKLHSGGLTNTTDGYDIDGIIDTVIPSTAWDSIWAA